MKASILALCAIAQSVSAHYWYDTTIYNGVSSGNTKFVRDLNRPVKYNPIKFSSNPASDIKDNSFIDRGEDARCNQGAFSSAGKTDVLTVNAGDEVTVKLAYDEIIEHPGPTLVYLSKAPSSVKNYDGSGDWFKIYQDGVCGSGDFTKNAWCSYGKKTLAAKVPKNTPNGEYLMRFEHIGVHRSHVNQPEHYIGCVQIKVQNGGSGTPGPMVKFPGAYKSTDPYATFSVYNGAKPFTFPGPAVWSGGGGGNNGGGGNGGGNNGGGSGGGGGSCAALYQQCGGKDHAGPTCCSQGSCKVSNEYYSQCV
ncbi:carbohydrate-binding module family 1 protein [Periconia macrospinosa]|uniref:AA9 family lytic polysaccharide monooxygenase n=1 Tax=Periconia macrospinosa TaxID=97972 RepID=A0A2V1D7R7_9PLEO|nr:carbohydrate-binding module family 1 protein [Periconia macrospinosa]